MKRPLIVLPSAEKDILKAAAWYDRHRPGLGHAFLMQTELTQGRIHRFPESYQQLRGETRRAVMRRFPYLVVYRNLPDCIEIIAVKHSGLNPEHIPLDPPIAPH